MTAERVVLDTNVLISAALIATGKPWAVLKHVVETGVLLFCDETFEELATRLMREKFDRYVSESTRHTFLVELAAVAEWTAITGAVHVCRDPDDDKLLETAIAGRADLLVTGDSDLLELHPFRGLSIVTPAAFMDAIG
ncbi:MAG: putative toxin-antitoxin system toxin component, PIN family [Gammaproteobacteria bacterium]|nr:putative toxin-antitoxin system toxin component, PIN family [Gammaproteobacteria bacterium]